MYSLQNSLRRLVPLISESRLVPFEPVNLRESVKSCFPVLYKGMIILLPKICEIVPQNDESVYNFKIIECNSSKEKLKLLQTTKSLALFLFGFSVPSDSGRT